MGTLRGNLIGTVLGTLTRTPVGILTRTLVGTLMVYVRSPGIGKPKPTA